MIRLIILVAVIVPVSKSHPFQLSYFNASIGGMSGALRRGLEVTYWWEGLSKTGCLDLINTLASPGKRIAFTPANMMYPEFLQSIGYLSSDFAVVDHTPFDYLVVMPRPYISYPALYQSVGIEMNRLNPVYVNARDKVILIAVFEVAPNVGGYSENSD